MAQDTRTPRPTTRIGILTIVSVVALSAMTLYLMVIAQAVMMPLVIAIFIVIVLDALAERICALPLGRRRLPNWLGIGLSILIMVAVLLGLLDIIVENVAAVGKTAPAYQAKLRRLLTVFLDRTGIQSLPSTAQLIDQINIAAALSKILSALSGVAGNALTILFYVAFILLEQATFKTKIKALFRDPDDAAQANETLRLIGSEIRKYAGLKSATSLLTALLSYGVLWWVGVDFAGFWALLIFVLNFIPYIGSLLGVLFPALLTLIQFDDNIYFIGVLVSLTLVQTLIGNVIEPRIMGRSLNLSPLVILLSLAVFGTIWGIVGMVLSIPFVVMAMIVCARFRVTRPLAVVLSATGRIDPRPTHKQPRTS